MHNLAMHIQKGCIFRWCVHSDRMHIRIGCIFGWNARSKRIHIQIGTYLFWILFNQSSRIGCPGPLIAFFFKAPPALTSPDLTRGDSLFRDVVVLQTISRRLHTAPSACALLILLESFRLTNPTAACGASSGILSRCCYRVASEPYALTRLMCMARSDSGDSEDQLRS